MAKVIKTYYDNGQLEEEYFENDGKIEGEYKKYFENGQLRIICNFVNGKKEGEFKSYHENGRVKTEVYASMITLIK